MSVNQVDQNQAPAWDALINQIAEYVMDETPHSDLAYETAHYCLIDTIGCGLQALDYPDCKALLGPTVPGQTADITIPTPATGHEVDVLKAAFDMACMNRWLDFNDTWLAAEWGHPSDNIGAILAVAYYVNALNKAADKPQITMKNVLDAMIRAHEIQGVMALDNSFNRVGLDHVVLVKLASAAVAMKLLGGDLDAVKRVISHVFVDGQSLRTYRHAPNAGSRKSWAAADAAYRAVWLCLMVQKGEMGYPSVLSTPTWGFESVHMNDKPLTLAREFGCYVMESVLFKISYPAEFHAQTAVECAIQLHPQIKDRLDQIKTITLHTHESAVRIISKTGPLHNFADRDHCLQYMVAIGLLKGALVAEDYQDDAAADPRIDALREKMVVIEDESYTRDYLDPEKRAIANKITITFDDDASLDPVEILYPLGHKFRREAGIPVLIEKAKRNFARQYQGEQLENIWAVLDDKGSLQSQSVDTFMGLLK